MMSIEITTRRKKDAEFEIDLLEIQVATDYPSEQITITLDDNTVFGLKTNKQGRAICETSIIQDYTVTVEIHGETYTEELIDQLFSQFCLGK